MSNAQHPRLIATYAFHLGHGNDVEIVRKGDWFNPPPTAQMSRADSSKMFVSQGAGRLPLKGEIEMGTT